MPDLVESEVAQVLASITFDTQVTHYTLIAGTAVWAYDVLLTFDDELSLLWSRGGLAIKSLYLINRYVPLVVISITLLDFNVSGGAAVDANSCRAHFVIISICQLLAIMVATTIFTIRLYTIYHGNKLAQRALALLAICSHLSLLVCGVIFIKETYDSMDYSEPFAQCVDNGSIALGGIYVTPILLESVIAFATLFHALKFRSQQRVLGQSSTTMKIMNALYIDGVMYYAIVLSLRIGVCLVYWVAPPSLITLLCYLEGFLTSVITSRWFLSFRRVLLDSLTPKESASEDMTRMTGAIIDFAPVGSAAADHLESRRYAVRSASDESDDDYFEDGHPLAEVQKSPTNSQFGASMKNSALAV